MYIVALGGNAILTPKEKGTFRQQLLHVRETMLHLRFLFAKGKEVVITHGNGPQVGNLFEQQEASDLPRMPLFILDAMTQAQIGYFLQNSLEYLGIKSAIVPTRILVDKGDSAFKRPTKPIGPFYKRKVYKYMTKTPYGFRRVVPCPKPVSIIDLPSIKTLLTLGPVIACGGGGIPVAIDHGRINGVEAVIDKDFASQLIGNELGADTLVIVTSVDCVYRNFRKSNQERIPMMPIAQAKEHLLQGHFEEGSMKPKIEASIAFIENGGKKVLITSPTKLLQAFEGKEGTILQ